MIDPDALRLTYAFRPAGTQNRLKDRLVGEPQVDLADYQFRAVFDWIEIGLPTGKELAAINVHKILMKLNKRHKGFYSCLVLGPQREKHHRGQYFIVKMQEPQPEGFVVLLREFLKTWGRRDDDLWDMPIVGLEMSLDAYPVGAGMSDTDRALVRMRMTGLMRKHLQMYDVFREGRRQPRFTYGPSKVTDMMLRPDSVAKKFPDFLASGLSKEDFAACHARFLRQPFIDSTFYYGEKDEQLHFRSMDKITDKRTEMGAEDLDAKNRRSRLEFTFVDEVPGDGRGPDSLKFRTVVDLLTQGFAATQQFLLFDLPTFGRGADEHNEPDAEEWAVFCKSGVLGLTYKLDVEDRLKADPRLRHAMGRRTFNSAGRCLKYSSLNRRVGRAIQRLEKRWQAAW
jgi:hypothetical protein